LTTVLQWSGIGPAPRSCPFDRSAEAKYPDIARFWDHLNLCKASEVLPSSQYIALFHCPNNAEHYFEYPVYRFMDNKKCRVCAGFQNKNTGTSGGITYSHKDDILAKTVRNGDCVEWSGNRTHQGHGLLQKATQTMSAHRVMYDLCHPESPAGKLHVRHLCNNPPCVNPDHLALNDNFQNTGEDRDNAGTNHYGESHPRCKLTTEQVLEIKNSPPDLSSRQVATEYPVTASMVRDIRTGRKRARETEGDEKQLENREHERLQRTKRLKSLEKGGWIQAFTAKWENDKIENLPSEPTKTGCLLWQGTIYKTGSGKFTFKDKSVTPHAAAAMVKYQRLKRKNLDEMAIHLCRERHCVALEHIAFGPTWVQTSAKSKGNKADILPVLKIIAQQHGCFPDPWKNNRQWAISMGIKYDKFWNILRGKTWRYTSIVEVGYDTLWNIDQATALECWDAMNVGKLAEQVYQETQTPLKFLKDLYFGMSGWRFVILRERGVDPYESHLEELTPALWNWFKNKDLC